MAAPVRSVSEESSFSELPRPAPLPTPKPTLHPPTSPIHTVKRSTLRLKSLQQERILHKQRLFTARSKVSKQRKESGWDREQIKCQLGRLELCEHREEQTEKLQLFTRRRAHTSSELPSQILLLSQESEVPRHCPTPIPPSADSGYVRNSFGKYKEETKAFVRGSKGPRANLIRCRQPVFSCSSLGQKRYS